MQAQQQDRPRSGASHENQEGSRQDSHHGPQQVSGNIPQQEDKQAAQPFEHDPHGPQQDPDLQQDSDVQQDLGLQRGGGVQKVLQRAPGFRQDLVAPVLQRELETGTRHPNRGTCMHMVHRYF